MREITGPFWEPLSERANLLDPLIRWVEREPERALASHRVGDAFVPVAARDLLAQVRAVAAGLVASGVEVGDRVALMSHSRLEWMVADFAILAAGAITVPIYETSSPEQVDWICRDSGARLVLVEDAAMRTMVEEVEADAPTFEEVLVIEDGALDDLATRGADVPAATIDERIAGLRRDQLASIVYTSGTTGRPKGCMLTHGNLRTNTIQSANAARSMLGEDEAVIIFLPLAHVLTKIIALVALEHGATTAFATDLAHLPEELPLARPTLIVSVPRVFEKVFNSAQQTAADSGRATATVFDLGVEVASRWSAAPAGSVARRLLAVPRAAFDRLLYTRIRAAFGGRLRFAFSGGSALGSRTTHFFNGAGVKIFEGYGLTETSPTLTINTAESWRPGTVGHPVAGTTVRIDDDGEILARGPQVFAGYWQAPEATAEVIDPDGWFHTGDIGEIDDDGFLRITGRKKDLIITAAGKNVAPAPLEDDLRAHPLVSQAVVIGDGKPFIAALLTVDEEAAALWAADVGLPSADLADHQVEARVRAELQLAVDAANEHVSRAESIRAFAVLPRDLSIEAGELTPTLKVRRQVVVAAHDEAIAEIYG